MNYHFEYSGPMTEEFGIIFGAVYGVMILISALISIAFYVLRSYGMYTVAKRRGLTNPWLIWIPVAGNWIIGSISDQYRYLVKEEIKSKRKLLLGFSVGNAVLNIIALIVAVVLAGTLIVSEGRMSDGEMAAAMMGPALTVLILAGILSVSKIVEYVLRQMCMYDLYRSCDPGNATAYLVLGILFGILEPIFLVAVRKKEDGMPPRRIRVE